MDGFIADIFRKRALKRHESKVPTGILPLGKINTYVVIVDVEDPSCDNCKTAVLNFFRAQGIRGSIFFQDFRKIGSEDRLITSIQTTITRKDVNWFGRPSSYKLGVMDSLQPDLFISLIRDPDYTMEYLVRTSQARFKIGRKQLEGRVFDMVVSDPAGKSISQLESFNAIKDYLLRIK